MKIKTEDNDSSFEEISGKDAEEDDVEEIKFNLSASLQEKPNESIKKELDVKVDVVIVEEKVGVMEEEKKPEKKSWDKDQPCPLNEKAIAKLDLWKSFPKYGKIIEGTNIIPCKTFLAKKRWTSNLKPEDQFTVPILVKEMADQGKKIGAIVDINNSENYYTWDITLKKNKALLSKVEYRKVKVPFNEIPRKKDMDKIYDVLNRHAFKDHLVVLHCTHGVNRTGYAICYFLCKKFGLKAREAIKRFEAARGYPFKYQELADDLMMNFDDWVMRESIIPQHLPDKNS